MATVAGRPEVRFEAQQDPRGCGAASLAMACRAFGRDVAQADVWAAIARANPRGIAEARSFELAAHAIALGLAAATIRARDPWAALSACARGPALAIVNHRPTPGRRDGHFSVLLDVEPDAVVLHDPRVGPFRRVPRREFLAMWSPDGPRSEIVGHVLVAIAPRSDLASDCPDCLGPVPATLPCPSCRFEIPTAPLACSTSGCPGRFWDRLYCPGCDASTAGDAPWWQS